MALKAILDTLDGLDASLHEHYKQDPKTNKFVLDMTDAESFPRIVALKDESARHRIAARDAVNKLTPYEALGAVTDIQAKLDKIPELETLANGKFDDKKLDQLVEARIGARVAPIERERDQLKTQLGDANTALDAFRVKDNQRVIADAVRAAALELKVTDSAIEDAIMYAERVFGVDETGKVLTKDGVGVTPGLEAKVWLTDMQTSRPHWWGPSQGGGAPGSRTGNGNVKNPFSAENWNLTEQGNLLRTNRSQAEQMAKAAGTFIGGPKPEARK